MLTNEIKKLLEKDTFTSNSDAIMRLAEEIEELQAQINNFMEKEWKEEKIKNDI